MRGLWVTRCFAVPARPGTGTLLAWRLELVERPGCRLDTEIAGVEHLNAGLMIALERRQRTRTSGSFGIRSVAEPQAQVCTGAVTGFDTASKESV